MSRPDSHADPLAAQKLDVGDVDAPLALYLRRAALSRLIASVAHDVRGAVASIVYSADFLDARGAEVQLDTLRETVREIYDASRHLQLTVDGLLDYAQLGPAISVPVSLHEVLYRVHGLLRSFYRERAPRLRVELAKGADWTRGNAVIVEQIFVNLVHTFAELGGPTSLVTVRTNPACGHGVVQVQVSGDSRGLATSDAASAAPSAGLSLARSALLDARVAAESQGGRVLLEQHEQHCCFTVELPRSEGPR